MSLCDALNSFRTQIKLGHANALILAAKSAERKKRFFSSIGQF